MVLTIAEQIFQTVQVIAGIIQIPARQRALYQQRQALQLLLRLEAREHFHTLTGTALGLIQARPRPQKLGANTQQELVHWQLFQMLLADQLERFFLILPGCLQEPLSK